MSNACFDVVYPICEEFFAQQDRNANSEDFLHLMQSCLSARHSVSRLLQKNFNLYFGGDQIAMESRSIIFKKLNALADHITTVVLHNANDSVFEKKWFPQKIETLNVVSLINDDISEKMWLKLGHLVPKVTKVGGMTLLIAKFAEKTVFENAKELDLMYAKYHDSKDIFKFGNKFPKLEKMELKIRNLAVFPHTVSSSKNVFPSITELKLDDTLYENRLEEPFFDGLDRFLQFFPALKFLTIWMDTRTGEQDIGTIDEFSAAFFNRQFKPEIRLMVNTRFATDFDNRYFKILDSKCAKLHITYSHYVTYDKHYVKYTLVNKVKR